MTIWKPFKSQELEFLKVDNINVIYFIFIKAIKSTVPVISTKYNL